MKFLQTSVKDAQEEDAEELQAKLQALNRLIDNFLMGNSKARNMKMAILIDVVDELQNLTSTTLNPNVFYYQE
ncbi:hypothetical protein KIN20_033923 [Parelaphostrongylus tenuis]|uniref:Uncharacterized protein n=1 Tax=Parelaphostrongylus tenuis TaxID=148309 RepID=A0AAD5R9A6_PARTN|nr:hypothetical protein KIN20_033923 [Parelaphostrongylus tenuis]